MTRRFCRNECKWNVTARLLLIAAIVMSVAGCATDQGLLRGFVPAGGHIYPGTKVYVQGREGYDNDPPKLEFTVVDPSVRLNGERWMLVRYENGTTDYVSRDTVALSDLYYVKQGEQP